MLLKVLVAVLIGGATYAFTVTMDQPAVWKLTASICLAGAALVVQYMVDFERRLSSAIDARNEEFRALLSLAFEQSASATKLFGQGEELTARPAERVAQVLRSTAEVDSGGAEVLEGFLRKEVSNLAGLLKGLSQDKVTYEGEDHDWIVALTKSATRTIDAISPLEDREFWAGELGQRYLHAQLEAIRTRHVRIRRVFLVDVPEQVSQLSDVLSQQQNFGIEVRVAALSELPRSAQLGDFHDFVIFDQALAYEVSAGRDTRTTIDLQGERVASRVQRFRNLWDAGGESSSRT
jgi:predicted signal transduction protein with EAL and GGDEF domain